MSVEVPLNTTSDKVRTPPPPPPAPCDVKVEVTGHVPVEIKQAITLCAMDMIEEEREQFYKHRGPEHYARYCTAKKNGCFNRCRKTDWCKVECEKKEKEKEELVQRNQLLEKHARQLETDFLDYKSQTDDRFNKLATLIASLK